MFILMSKNIHNRMRFLFYFLKFVEMLSDRGESQRRQWGEFLDHCFISQVCKNCDQAKNESPIRISYVAGRNPVYLSHHLLPHRHIIRTLDWNPRWYVIPGTRIQHGGILSSNPTHWNTCLLWAKKKNILPRHISCLQHY